MYMDKTTTLCETENTTLLPKHGYNLRKRFCKTTNKNLKKSYETSARTRPVVFKRRKRSKKQKINLIKIDRELVMAVQLKSAHQNKASKTSIHINKLPVCVLTKIFKMLYLFDRIKVERVCRRWNYISRNYSWNDTIKINFDSLFPFVSEFHLYLHSELTAEYLSNGVKTIINRSGKYLTNLNLSRMLFLNCKVSNLLKHTPKVTNLNLSGVMLTNTALFTIGSYLPLLKAVSFSNCFKQTQVERGLLHFFNSCKTLEYLDISENEYFRGDESFKDLPSSLTTLNIGQNFRMINEAFENIAQNCLNLKHLTMDRVLLIRPLVLNQLLESLNYSECLNHDFSKTEIISIAHLQKLKKLTLCDNTIVTDNFLKALSYCAELEHLEISSLIRKTSNQGFQFLANLPKLAKVDFGGLGMLSDKILKDIAANGQIKELLLHRCYKISDDSIVYLINHCKNLIALDVSYCPKVTNQSYNVLLQKLKTVYLKLLELRAEGPFEKFRLWARRSGILPQEETTPLLTIMSDNTIKQLQMWPTTMHSFQMFFNEF